MNDSDSWSYLLAAPDGTVSEFDSAENEDDDDDGEAAATWCGRPRRSRRSRSLMQDGTIQQRMQQIQQQMSADAPPEIRAAEERHRTRQGTAADMQQYQAWAMQQMPKYMDEFKSLLGGALGMPPPCHQASPPGRTQGQRKAERAAQRERLDDLRPIFAAGTTDEQVQAVFERRAVFAEEVLAEFLPLVGISADSMPT